MKEHSDSIHSNPVSLNGLTIIRFDFKPASGSIKVLLLVALFVFATGPDTLAQEPFLRQVRRFKMSELGMANPAGLAFSPAANKLLVAPDRDNTDLIFVTAVPDLDGSETIATAIVDPVNTAFDGKSNCLFIFDTRIEELVEIKVKRNGLSDMSIEAITRFNAKPFQIKEAQGMTFDPETGALFFLVVPALGAGPRIVCVVPDPQHRFDVPVVSSIALSSLRRPHLRGIALNPGDGHLYVMSPAEQELNELSNDGEILTTRDLSAFELRDVQNMVFAPSGDQTDDPSINSLYVADHGLRSGQRSGDVIELSLTKPMVLDLSALTVQTSPVQTILTSEWSPPSPDPSGIAYIPSSNSLFISDAEVAETPLFKGVSVWQTTLSGSQISEFSTTFFSDEPSGLAFNPRNRHLFFCDDTGPRSVYEVDPGPDGLYDTTDDIITSFSTGDFGSYDAEGIAYDTFQGHLFVSDGSNAEVYEVSPGANGVFDGMPPIGDDVLVQHFDTARLGLNEPEGVEFNTDTGNLYIASNSRPNTLVIETTRAGTAVGAIDFSAVDPKSPAGLAYAPNSRNSAERSLYIVDRGVDNNFDPNENDGKIYEIALGQIPPGIVINDVVVTEGNAGTVKAEFTVSLSGISKQTVRVDYATRDGSAKAGSDYVASSGQIIFQPGETSQPVIVSVNGEWIDEPDETFLVKLSNAVNANLGDDQGIGTITNDDGPNPVTVCFQDGVNGYNSMRDASLFSDTPDTNYGSAIRLAVDGSPRQSAVLSWSVTSIPPGSTIKAVDMTINVTNTAGVTYLLYDLKRPWIENEATWNEYASDQNWEVAGGDGPRDRGPFPLGRIEGASLGPVTIPLNAAGVALVQSWVDNPATNYGFIILDYNRGGDALEFSSRENQTVARRPKLTVTYTCKDAGLTVGHRLPPGEQLHQNYPNPFNPSTKISYLVPSSGFVTLKVHDVLGKEVQTLVSEFQEACTRSVDFKAGKLPSGIYFYTLRIGDDLVQTKKMLLLR